MAPESCSNEFNCKDISEICSNGVCVCGLNFYNNNGSCAMCPGFQQSCHLHRCCAQSYYECQGGVCACINGAASISCSYNGSSMYVSASQIALSAALIMGMAALTMVVYRLCTKPRYLSARQRALASQMGFNIENETLSYANYLRASLTSMQIRVLTRMRDRPPTYDNRPTAIDLPEAPPPYEGDSEGTALPPPYVEVVISPTGYTNSTFINPEPDGQNNRNIVCPNCELNQQQRRISFDKQNKTGASASEKIETREEI